MALGARCCASSSSRASRLAARAAARGRGAGGRADGGARAEVESRGAEAEALRAAAAPGRSAGALLAALRRVGSRRGECPEAVRTDAELLRALARRCAEVAPELSTGADTADALACLARIGAPLDADDAVALAERAAALADGMRPRDVALALWGLGKLGAKPGAAPLDALAARAAEFGDAGTLDARDVSNVLYGLACCRHRIKPRAAESLARALGAAAGAEGTRPHALTNSMWGLAEMRCQAPAEVLQAVEAAAVAPEVLRRFNARELGNLLREFNRLGHAPVELDRIVAELHERLDAGYDCATPVAHTLGACVGFAERGVRWPPARTLDALIGHAFRQVGGMRAVDARSLLWAVTRLNKWHPERKAADRTLVRAVVVRLGQLAGVLTPSQLGSVVWAVGWLRVDAARETHGAFALRALELRDELSFEQLAVLVWGWSRVGYDPGNTARDALFHALHTVLDEEERLADLRDRGAESSVLTAEREAADAERRAQLCCLLLHGLGMRDSRPPRLVERVVNMLRPQDATARELARAVIGMGAMRPPLSSELASVPVLALARRADELFPADAAQVLQACRKMRYNPGEEALGELMRALEQPGRAFNKAEAQNVLSSLGYFGLRTEVDDPLIEQVAIGESWDEDRSSRAQRRRRAAAIRDAAFAEMDLLPSVSPSVATS